MNANDQEIKKRNPKRATAHLYPQDQKPWNPWKYHLFSRTSVAHQFVDESEAVDGSGINERREPQFDSHKQHIMRGTRSTADKSQASGHAALSIIHGPW